MTKADFNGAVVTISNSTNPTSIGISGIIVKETTRTFIIFKTPKEGVVLENSSDNLKTILKRGNVFRF